MRRFRVPLAGNSASEPRDLTSILNMVVMGVAYSHSNLRPLLTLFPSHSIASHQVSDPLLAPYALIALRESLLLTIALNSPFAT